MRTLLKVVVLPKINFVCCKRLPFMSFMPDLSAFFTRFIFRIRFFGFDYIAGGWFARVRKFFFGFDNCSFSRRFSCFNCRFICSRESILALSLFVSSFMAEIGSKAASGFWARSCIELSPEIFIQRVAPYCFY